MAVFFFGSVLRRRDIALGGTCTNSLYYTTSFSMSINVNKRMCRAFAKVMYFTIVIACKLHSLRLLANLREKYIPLDGTIALRSSIAPLSNPFIKCQMSRVIRFFFTHYIFMLIICVTSSFLPMHIRRK